MDAAKLTAIETIARRRVMRIPLDLTIGGLRTIKHFVSAMRITVS
jgi:hypothetical protein